LFVSYGYVGKVTAATNVWSLLEFKSKNLRFWP